MARSFTLAQLATKVRERADQENSTFIDDTELYGYISASYCELYDLLVQSGLHYFETTDTITGVSGTTTYALPSDHYATVAIDYQEATNDWRALPEFMVAERNRYQQDTGGNARGYRIVGTNVELLPSPSTGDTYRHLYIPAPADLTSASDTIDGVSGWEELIVLDATIKCYIKEESSTVQVREERDRLLARIEAAKENRMWASPRRVVDTAYENGWLPGDFTRGR